MLAYLVVVRELLLDALLAMVVLFFAWSIVLSSFFVLSFASSLFCELLLCVSLLSPVSPKYY